MELTYEEMLLIQSIRDVKVTPFPVLIGFRNRFYNDNANKQWDDIIEILDSYINKMVGDETKEELD